MAHAYEVVLPKSMILEQPFWTLSVTHFVFKPSPMFNLEALALKTKAAI
jgi:hypothetical protein